MLNNFRDKLYKLLRQSERYFKTDMVYFAKGSAWITAGKIFSSAAIFLLAIAFANLLSKETYGTYKYILSLTSILGLATLSGMNVAVTQAVARGYEGVVIPTIKTRIHWGVLGGLASIGVAGYYYLNHNNTLTLSFLLIAAFLPFFESFMTYDSFLQGKKLFGKSSIYGVVSQIAAVILMILTLLITQNLFIILLVYFSSWTLIRFICLQITLKKFKPNKECDPEIVSYGKHMSLIDFIGNAIGSLDNIIIFHFLGASEVAIYSFAVLPIVQLQGFTKSLSALAMPKFAQRPLKEIKLLLWERMKFLFFSGLIISLIYIIIAPSVFKVFFPKYIDSVFLSQIFSLSIALSLILSILDSVLNSKLTIIPKKLLYLWNVPFAVFLLLMFLFIQQLGVIGIILAKIITIPFGIGINLIIWKKINKREDPQITLLNQQLDNF